MADLSNSQFESQFQNWQGIHPFLTNKEGMWTTQYFSGEFDRIIRCQLNSADQIIASQDRIAEGLESLKPQLDDISYALDDIGGLLDWGFTEVIWTLEQNQIILEQILETLLTPLDTQAKELRGRAFKSYRNGLVKEALTDFLKSEKKNPYDFDVLQSIGNIYFIHEKNPDKAIEYFEKTAKYAAPESKYFASNAYLHMALVYYLNMDYQKAYEYSYKAKTLSPSMGFAFYEHARHCAKLGIKNETLINLNTAFRHDILYLLKAMNEPDFIEIKRELFEIAKRMKDIWKTKVTNESDKLENLFKDINSYKIDYKSEDLDRYVTTINKVKLLMERDSIIDFYEAWNLIIYPEIKISNFFMSLVSKKIAEFNNKIEDKGKEEKNLSFLERQFKGNQIQNDISLLNRQISELESLQRRLHQEKFHFADIIELKQWTNKNQNFTLVKDLIKRNPEAVKKGIQENGNFGDFEMCLDRIRAYSKENLNFDYFIAVNEVKDLIGYLNIKDNEFKEILDIKSAQ